MSLQGCEHAIGYCAGFCAGTEYADDDRRPNQCECGAPVTVGAVVTGIPDDYCAACWSAEQAAAS